MYSKKDINHFTSPQNIGSMTNADGEGTVADLESKNTLTVYVRVQFRIITEISFTAVGSSSIFAVGSLVTSLAKDRCIDEAMTISEQDVFNKLGELPEEERQCANLGVSALRKAIENYAIQRGIYSCQIDRESFSVSKSNFSVKK